MDLIFIGLAIVTAVVAWTGVVAFTTFASGVWYGKFFWAREEYAYAGRLLQTGWRGRANRFWRAVKYVLRYEAPALPSNLPPGPVVFAAQPHGVLAVSAAIAVFSGDLDRPGSRTVLVLHGWYWWVWGVRDLVLALGAIDREWSSIENAVANGFSVAILPGGVFEMGPPTVPPPDVFGVVREIKEKLDLLPLVPLVLRGEDDVCWVWHGEPRLFARVRAWFLKKVRAPVLVIFCPRVWAWPRLAPQVGKAIDARNYVTVAAFQKAYESARDALF